MAQDTLITCPTATWTELTDAEVTTDISIALFIGPVKIRATASASAPTGTDGFPLLSQGDGWSEATIAEKFPGIAGANRIWAMPDRADSESATVRISHA